MTALIFSKGCVIMPKSTAKKKTLTPNQIAYNKQVKRIEEFYKKAEKRGYRFVEKEDLTIPKRVTQQSIERLAKIKPRDLYKKAEYLDEISGKIISGTEGRTLERRKAYYNGKEKQIADAYYTPQYTEEYSPPNTVDDVLSNIDDVFNKIDSYDHKDSWSPDFRRIKDNDKSILSNMLYGAISELGTTNVAYNIEQNATELMKEIESVIYGESGDKKDGVQPNLMRIHKILYGRNPSLDEGVSYYDKHERWGTQLSAQLDQYEPED